MDSEQNRILALCEAIRRNGADAETTGDDLETVYTAILSCADYIKSVIASETLRLQRGGMEPKELGQRFSELDSSRTHTHDGMISNIHMLNKLCRLYGVPDIYQGKEERACYGDFALRLVSAFFEDRQRGVTSL